MPSSLVSRTRTGAILGRASERAPEPRWATRSAAATQLRGPRRSPGARIDGLATSSSDARASSGASAARAPGSRPRAPGAMIPGRARLPRRVGGGRRPGPGALVLGRLARRAGADGLRVVARDQLERADRRGAPPRAVSATCSARTARGRSRSPITKPTEPADQQRDDHAPISGSRRPEPSRDRDRSTSGRSTAMAGRGARRASARGADHVIGAAGVGEVEHRAPASSDTRGSIEATPRLAEALLDRARERRSRNSAALPGDHLPARSLGQRDAAERVDDGDAPGAVPAVDAVEVGRGDQRSRSARRLSAAAAASRARRSSTRSRSAAPGLEGDGAGRDGAHDALGGS